MAPEAKPGSFASTLTIQGASDRQSNARAGKQDMKQGKGLNVNIVDIIIIPLNIPDMKSARWGISS
ncbi:MAG: hypothetical protein WCK34_11745 [Bacteroidota bacterium]